LVGEEWGDESDTFLSMLDVMVKVGGGKQSVAEAEKAEANGLSVMKFDLKAE